MRVEPDAAAKTEARAQALRGGVAFVAGGTSGISLEIAKAFAGQGARIAVMSRSKAKVDAAVAELRSMGGTALGFAADVRDFPAVDAALKDTAAAFGELSAIVSGAAGNFLAPAARLSSNGFRAVVDIDLIGTFNVLRAGYDVVSRDGASMITISAPQATRTYRGQAHASAAKSGVEMLTRALAHEWGPEGIRVNAIVPGAIEGTEGLDRVAPGDAARAELLTLIPLRRFGTSAEVASMAVFLASSSSAYVTGSILYCDGGHTLVGPGAGL